MTIKPMLSKWAVMLIPWQMIGKKTYAGFHPPKAEGLLEDCWKYGFPSYIWHLRDPKCEEKLIARLCNKRDRTIPNP
jgi:hypothetical protein